MVSIFISHFSCENWGDQFSHVNLTVSLTYTIRPDGFIHRLSYFSSKVELVRLQLQRWPGNFSQLSNWSH